MVRRHGFTLINLMVTCFIIGILITIALPSLRAAREQGKRVLCLSHVKQLQFAWLLYAEDHQGNIVTGQAWHWKNPRTSSEPNTPSKGWLLGRPVASTGEISSSLSSLGEHELQDSIRNGALYPYLHTDKPYTCARIPQGRSAYPLPSYSIVESMGGPTQRLFGCNGSQEVFCGKSHPYVININQIYNPPAQNRMVFICTETAWPSYRVPYYLQTWLGWPPVHHAKGTCVSFADGHSEIWRWSEPSTLALGQLGRNGTVPTQLPADGMQPMGLSNADVTRLQQAVWGTLGYETIRKNYTP